MPLLTVVAIQLCLPRWLHGYIYYGSPVPRARVELIYYWKRTDAVAALMFKGRCKIPYQSSEGKVIEDTLGVEYVVPRY